VSISSTFYEHLLRQYFYANISAPKKLQSQYVTREKLRKALLYKKLLLNSDEIDTCSSQFHKHFTHAFCTNIFATKN